MALWPKDGGQIPDREPIFTVVYLPLEWAEQSEPDLDRYVRDLLENRAGGKREFRNTLCFAVPSRQPADSARAAVRTLLAIDGLKTQRKRFGFSPEQLEELDEKRKRADDDLVGALRRLYEVVKLPVVAEAGPDAVQFETVDLRAQLSTARIVQERVLDGLRRWVHGEVKAHKIVSLTKLGQPPETGGRDFVSCDQLVRWFFGVLDFPKLLGEEGLRKGIAEGIASPAQFGYVPVGRSDGAGGLVVDRPSVIRLGETVRPEEIDLAGDAYLLAPAMAARLRPSPAVPPGGEQGGQTGTGGTGTTKGTEPERHPGKAGTRYVLDITASKAEVFQVFPALQNLSDRSKSMTVRMHVEAEAQETFDPTWLRNAVEEPLDEAGAEKRGRLEE